MSVRECERGPKFSNRVEAEKVAKARTLRSRVDHLVILCHECYCWHVLSPRQERHLRADELRRRA